MKLPALIVAIFSAASFAQSIVLEQNYEAAHALELTQSVQIARMGHFTTDLN